MEKSWKLFSIFNDFLTKLKKLSRDEIDILSGCDEIEKGFFSLCDLSY